MLSVRTLLTAGLVSLGISLAGCGDSDDLSALTKLKDEACACKDDACWKNVEKKYEALEGKMKEKYKEKKPSKEFKEKWMKIMDEAKACETKYKKEQQGE